MRRLQLFRCKRRTSGGKRRTVFDVGGLESVRRGRVTALALLEVVALRANQVIVLAICKLKSRVVRWLSSVVRRVTTERKTRHAAAVKHAGTDLI